MRSQITITQGEFAVSSDPGCVIATILGSCVSTCLWDPGVGVGGMNHILVARSGTGETMTDAAGVNAMELLINALIRAGATRSDLKAKVFGGARMISGLSDVGRVNAQFALEFLQREGIACLGSSLGGAAARQVKFLPSNGQAFVKTVSSRDAVEVAPRPAPARSGNGVELF